MPPLTAALYSWPTLTGAGTALTTATDMQVTDTLNEAGAASITLPILGGETALFAEDGNDVVVFSHAGQRVLAMLVEKITSTTIDTNEYAGEAVTYSGRGVLAVLEQAVIYPTINVGRAPVESDRLFGWMNYFYVETGAWVAPEDYGSIDDLAAVGAFLLGQPLADVEAHLLNAGIPDLALRLYWAPGYSITDAPTGRCYFRDGLFVPTDGDYYVFFYCDDSGSLWIDGQETNTVTGINFLGVDQQLVTMTAGFHQVAFTVYNDPVAGTGTNAGKVGFAVYTTTTAYLNPLGFEVGTLVQQMTPDFSSVLPYPADEPGMTPGNAYRIAHEEAALATWVSGRDRLSPITLTFDDDQDSDAVDWPTLANIATKTGGDMHTWVASELAGTYVDVWIDPETLELSMWAIGTRGTTPGVTLAQGVNLQAFQVDTEIDPVSVILLKHKGGWAERVDTGAVSDWGRREVTLEIGSPVSLDEVYRIADKQLDAFKVIRQEITATLTPTGALGFACGDTITTPIGAERVRARTFRNNGDSDATVTVTLRDWLLDDAERLAQSVSKGV